MKIVLAIVLLVTSSGFAEEVVRSAPNAAGFPTKPGEYIHKQWKYIYEIQNAGTRSEIRIGRLFLEGEPVDGNNGELFQELFGHFIYFGDRGWNQGWLNTLTYNRPVFGKDGNLTEEAMILLSKVSDKE